MALPSLHLQNSLLSHHPSTLTPQMKNHHDENHSEEPWTVKDAKLFENIMAEFGTNIGSSDFFEHVAALMPWKSMKSIELYYKNLVEDLHLIESSQSGPEDDDAKEEESSKAGQQKAKRPRARGVPWTEQEHMLFLLGLQHYGKGEWKNIAKYFVTTKTPTQVASHAQKFNNRINCRTPIDKRRQSINDIQVVDDSCLSAVYHQRLMNFQPSVPENLVPTTLQHSALNQVSFPGVYNNYCSNVDQQALNATMPYHNGDYVNFPSVTQPWGYLANQHNRDI